MHTSRLKSASASAGGDVARGEYIWLQLMHQLHPFLDKDFAIVTHALIMSQLDYCSMLFLGLPLKMIWSFDAIGVCHMSFAQA